MQISPDAPCVSELPSSSLMAMSMPGSGRPMLPENSWASTGLLVPMAQVSLMPQPSTIGQPVVSNHCLAVPLDAAMPPACVEQRLEKSTVLNCGCDSSALNKVLT